MHFARVQSTVIPGAVYIQRKRNIENFVNYFAIHSRLNNGMSCKCQSTMVGHKITISPNCLCSSPSASTARFGCRNRPGTASIDCAHASLLGRANACSGTKKVYRSISDIQQRSPSVRKNHSFGEQFLSWHTKNRTESDSITVSHENCAPIFWRKRTRAARAAHYAGVHMFGGDKCGWMRRWRHVWQRWLGKFDQRNCTTEINVIGLIVYLLRVRETLADCYTNIAFDFSLTCECQTNPKVCMCIDSLSVSFSSLYDRFIYKSQQQCHSEESQQHERLLAMHFNAVP